jgi:signal transduction histidine kinase
MRAYLVRLLRGRGTVEAIGDGATALEIARARPPNLIIADVMLPGLNGLELVEALRDDPELRFVPVILLSARAGDQARVQGLRAGADDYLVKPFSVAELLARVDSQLDLVRERGEAQAVAERRRLARDLHDSVSQTLYAANVTADALPELWVLHPAEGRRALTDLRRLTRAAQAEMRSLLLELRPEALAQTPLDELLQTLVSTAATKSPAAVEARLEPAPGLPSDVHETLYRIAQEALHNAVKHAGAPHLRVCLASTPDGALRLEVADDGVGFDPEQAPSGRLGLRSMRERASSIGATLDLTSEQGGGTRVYVTWTGLQAAGLDAPTSPPPSQTRGNF